MPRTVIAAVDDMLFVSKIRAAAENLGVDVRFVRSIESAVTAAKETSTDLIIVDLQSQKINPLELAQKVRCDKALRPTRVLGFFSHVMKELQQAALDAGFDTVLPRSAFSRDLPAILKDG